MLNFYLPSYIVAARRISTGFKSCKNHYEVLGVSPGATQSDIKAAYYRLSMLYHPDRNKGSKKAAEKFCDITTAYEVLGNYRLRKMYDKGILPNDEARDGTKEEPHRRYTTTYRSRAYAQKQQTDSFTGKYDFGEWTRKHYGESFTRRNTAKMHYEQKVKSMAQDADQAKKERVAFAVIVFFMMYGLMSYIGSNGLDDVRLTRNHVSVKRTINKTS